MNPAGLQKQKRKYSPHWIVGISKHANGVVEYRHNTLHEALLKACRDNIGQWPRRLHEAVFADRITVHQLTGFSPYHLLHATESFLPLDLFEATFLVEGFHAAMTTTELLALRMRHPRQHFLDIAKSHFTSKAQFEKRFTKQLLPRDFKPGKLVLAQNTETDQNIGLKEQLFILDPLYEAYKLKQLDGAKFTISVTAFQLMPYIQGDH
ncbi:hypothetical protein L218DRAFT_973793 [Marasmius fiardii PR-910]|nr:hypothetical protein L218DRAFT_973793 [Marasmius fiardii PR-910]